MGERKKKEGRVTEREGKKRERKIERVRYKEEGTEREREKDRQR